MNSLVKAYRSKNPNDQRSDDEIILQLGQRNPGVFDRWPDAKKDYDRLLKLNDPEYQARLREATRPGLIEDFKTSLSGAVDSTQAMLWGAGGLAAGVVEKTGLPGAKQTKEFLLEQAADNMKEAEGNQPFVPSYKDVKNWKDAANYISGLAGAATPSLAESAAAGIVGTMVGAGAGSAVAPGPGTAAGGVAGAIWGVAEKQAIKTLIKQKVIRAVGKQALTKAEMGLVRTAAKKKVQKYAAQIAIGVNSYAVNAGETYLGLVENHNVDPDDAVNYAVFAGAVKAVPDSILPSYVAGKLIGTGVKGVAKEEAKKKFYGYFTRLLSEAGKTVPGEALGEGFQEFVDIATERYVDPTQRDQPWTPDLTERIINSAAAGGLAGLMMAPAAAIPSTQGSTSDQPNPDAKKSETDVGESGVDPAASYKPSEAEVAEVEELARRVFHAEDDGTVYTPEDEARVAEMMATSPQLYRTYLQARRRLREERNAKEVTADPKAEKAVEETFKQMDQDDPSELDAKANEAAASTTNTTPAPTESQKESGSYKKGRIKVAGLDIAIENPQGSQRRPEWPALTAHYGYINGTVGADGDHLDVFVKPGTAESWTGQVYVVNQLHPEGHFDEHKVVIGATSEEDARQVYLSNYDHTQAANVLSIAEFGVEDFKKWAKQKKGKKAPAPTKAVSKAREAAVGYDVSEPGDQINDQVADEQAAALKVGRTPTTPTPKDQVSPTAQAEKSGEPTTQKSKSAPKAPKPGKTVGSHIDNEIARLQSLVAQTEKSLEKVGNAAQQVDESVKAKVRVGELEQQITKLQRDLKQVEGRIRASHEKEMRTKLDKLVKQLQSARKEITTQNESKRSISIAGKLSDRLQYLNQRLAERMERKALGDVGAGFTAEDIEWQRTDVTQGKSGRTKTGETFPSFYEADNTAPAGKALSGPFSVALGDQLTSQARTKEGPNSNTLRLTVFEAKDGTVHLLGTYKRNRVQREKPEEFQAKHLNDKTGYFVVNPDGGAAVPLKTMLDQGYKILASVRSAIPMKDAAWSYANREQFERELAAPARSRKAAESQRTAQVEGGLQQRKSEQEGRPPADVPESPGLVAVGAFGGTVDAAPDLEAGESIGEVPVSETDEVSQIAQAEEPPLPPTIEAMAEKALVDPEDAVAIYEELADLTDEGASLDEAVDQLVVRWLPQSMRRIVARRIANRDARLARFEEIKAELTAEGISDVELEQLQEELHTLQQEIIRESSHALAVMIRDSYANHQDKPRLAGRRAFTVELVTRSAQGAVVEADVRDDNLRDDGSRDVQGAGAAGLGHQPGSVTRYARRSSKRSQEDLEAELASDLEAALAGVDATGGASQSIDGEGWILPGGGFIPAADAIQGGGVRMAGGLSFGGHEEAAIEWLKQNKPEWYAELLEEIQTTLLETGSQYADRGDSQGVVRAFMFKKGFVRVAGDRHSLFLEGQPTASQMRFARSSAIELGAELSIDRPGMMPRVVYSPIDRFRVEAELAATTMTPEQVARVFRLTVDRLRTQGVNMKVLRRQIADQAGRFTKKLDTQSGAVVKAIMVAMQDASGPTTADLVTLMHEVGHLIFNDLSPQRRLALQNAIRRASDAQLKIEGFRFTVAEGADVNAVTEEERLVEAVARELVAEGFNVEDADGVAARLWQAVKDVIVAVALSLQEAFGITPSPELAQAYMRRRVEALVTGDTPLSMRSFLGGMPGMILSQEEEFQAGVIIRNRNLDYVGDAETAASPDLDNAALFERQVAAQNEVLAAAMDIYTAWHDSGGNTAGLTFDQFLASGNFLELESAPAEVIQRIVQRDPSVQVDTTLATTTSPTSRQQAAALAHKVLRVAAESMAKRRTQAEHALNPSNANSLSNQRQRAAARILDLTSKYEDAELMLNEALYGNPDSGQLGVVGLVKQLEVDIASASSNARRAGVLSQAIRAIDKTAPLKQYQKLINGLAKQITGPGSAKFMDLLIEVGKLDYDWQGLSIPDLVDALQLAAQESSTLKVMADNKALLAVVASFAKTNSHVLDLLGLSRSKKVEERKAANEALDHATRSHATAVREARDLARKLPTLGRRVERILNKLERVRRENRELLDQIVREESFVEFHQTISPLLKSKLAKLESEIGAVNEEWEATHGAQYFVPPKADSDLGVVANSRKTLRLTANGMLASDVRADMGRMIAWLDNVPADQRGALWRTVRRQYDKLSWMDLNWAHNEIQNSVINKLMGSLPERLRFVGTPAARSAAARIEKFVFWWESKERPGKELGTKWEVAEGKAMEILGYKDRHAFQSVFLRHGLSFIEKRQDLLAKYKDSRQAEDVALQELRKYFEGDPELGALVKRKGAWPALEAYYRQTAANSTWFIKNNEEMGIKIKDGDLYRDALGAAPFHVPRTISKEAEAVYRHMQSNWMGTVDIAAMAEENPEALAELLKARFDERVWREFVRPITRRTGRSSFYAPADGGEARFASRENVMKAAEAAGGDFMRFAQALFELEGGTGDFIPFAAETMETFQSFFNVLHEINQEVAKASDNHAPLPRRFLADARKSEEFPAEFLDYMPYDIHHMRQVSKFQAMHAAFGRDNSAWRADTKTAIDEQRVLADEFKAIKAMFPTLTGRKLDRAVKAEVARRGGNWRILSQADRQRQTLQQAETQMVAFLSMSRDRPMEILPLQEIVGTLAGLAVSGPGTALTDTSAIFVQPFRRFGFDAEALRQITGTVKSLAKVSFGSLLQAAGRQARQEAEHMAIAMRLGLYDDDAKLTLKERLRSALTEEVAGDPATISGKVGRAATHAARAARVILTSGRGRQKGEFAYPTAKPHSVFVWQAQLVHLAETISWWKRYESYVAKAVEHFQNNPSDFDNNEFDLTPEIIGLNSRAWEYIHTGVARYGLSLDQIARDAYRRRQKDPTSRLLTDDQYRALAQMAQNEITLDSSLSTRPPGFMTNPAMNLANPLLGWAISMGYDAWRGFRQPDGKRSWAGFRTGLLAYAAILPIALAWAYMRDEYDEQIIGRKQNVLKFGQGNPFAAMVDMTARVGTFGIFGEIPNSVINVDTNRELSVDSRVFMVNTLLGLKRAVEAWIHQDGVTDWQSVGRPLVQSLGGSGYLQYADALNNMLALDNQEARVARRIGTNNYLRAAGRALDMDVRTGRGMGAIPTKVKPYIGQMVVAAMSNDAAAFRRAHKKARQAARDVGKSDPDKHVLQSFQAYHPLRYVFRTMPTEGDYRRLLNEIGGDGRMQVERAISLLNHYSEQIGGSATVGRQRQTRKVADPYGAAAAYGR